MYNKRGTSVWVLIVAKDVLLRQVFLGLVDAANCVGKSPEGAEVEAELFRLTRGEVYDIVLVAGEQIGLKIYDSLDEHARQKLIFTTGGLGEELTKTGRPVLRAPVSRQALEEAIKAVLSQKVDEVIGQLVNP